MMHDHSPFDQPERPARPRYAPNKPTVDLRAALGWAIALSIPLWIGGGLAWAAFKHAAWHI